MSDHVFPFSDGFRHGEVILQVINELAANDDVSYVIPGCVKHTHSRIGCLALEVVKVQRHASVSTSILPNV